MVDIFQPILKEITTILSNELDQRLVYHNTDHTLDVISQAERIAIAENVSSSHDRLLLRIAALFHDTGFLYVYGGHEEKSCEIARARLMNMVAGDDLDIICGLIMATKVPQRPQSLLQQIICDADLDYLGRPDFIQLSNHLKNEFLDFGIVKNLAEWEQKQIGFFESHQYFTRTSIENRLPLKMEHLAELKKQMK